MSDATTPAPYEHRAMRCKLDRTVRVEGRRYRPGEPFEGEVPAKHKDDFEEGVVVHTPAPVSGPRVVKVRPELPAKGLDKPKTELDE